MRIFLSAFLVVCAQFAVAQADVPGCNIEIACNYDPAATLNDGSCDFTSCLVLGCTDAAACNYNPAATINDGSCDYLSCLVPGCTLANACNFDASAEVNDGSCEYTSCAGCTNPFADNYDDTATVDDGSCNPIEGCTSPQACNFNENANQDDGSCDFVSCLATGCTVLEACNYDAEAQVNDGTCIFPEEGRDCNGVCLEDADGDDVCDGDEIAGCTSATALNYNPIATDDDGSCQEPVGGCTDPEACNFDALATNDDGSCEFTSCAGCLQQAACNYDSTAIYADDSCEFPPFGYDCDGNCLNDADGDDVCDPFEVVGCQDESACNFDPAATDPGQCNFATPNFDCDGNSLRPIFTSFPANVTVQGWQVPAIEDAIVEAIASPFAPSFEATYNGNDCYDSDPTPSISFLGETKIDGVCEHDYTLFRSWMATDCSGYTRTREQIIVVVDTVPPVLFVPEAMTVLCQDAATADFGEAYGTDDCGDVTIEISEEIVSGDCPGNYTIVRTFSAMDPCLNTATGQQEITVIDNEAPVILALADRSLDCSDEMPTDMPEATDNCGNVTISVVETVIPGTCANEYSIERLFTATDECGNESTSTQLISVSDNTAPTVVSGYNGCDDPATCAIAVDGLQGETLPAADLELSDDCDDAPVFASSDEVLSSTDALEVILREYTISDACGNTLVLQEQYNVTLVNPGCTDEAACNYDADANVSDGSCDFCSCGQNACGCLDQEACNYDSSAEYDDDSCTYADPGFDCDGICYDINDNDVCDFEEAGCTDASACNYDSFAQVDDGSCDYCCAHDIFTSTEAGYGVSIDLVQTHTTGDLAGLSTYRVYVTTPNADDVLTAVTGGDEFPLELHTTTSFYQNVFGGCLGTNISPGMMVVAPDAAYDSWVTIGATSSDDVVDGEVQLIPGAWIESFEAGNSITVNDNLGSGWFLIPPGGVNGVSGDDNRILVAQLTTDGVISGSFRVQIFPSGDQVNDVRPDLTFEQQPLGAFACPIIEEGPADAVVSCDDIPGLPGEDEFTLSYDNATADALGCDGALQITLVSDDITEGDCIGNYTILRTVEIENCAGGTAQHTYTLTVEDTTAPEFSEVPEDYTVECSAEMVMADASASDNCSEVSIEVSSETIAGNATGNYTLVRTFTATDACGNSSTATQTITVEDTTAPVFTSVPEAYTVECSDDMVLEDATAEDNCNGADIQVTSEIIAGNATGNYTVIRTFTATDDAGNSASATQTITVQDTTAPEFTNVPSDYTTECSDDLVFDGAYAIDNCNGAVISESVETIAGDAAGNYTVVRTFTATDDAGNTASATQTITVQDTTAPELSIPADYAAECTEELVLDDATATDNCGSVVVDVSTNEVAGDCPGTKVVTRTFTATDDAGNSTSATQTITVQDTTAPELTIPADYTAECDEDLVLEAATATDNCTTCEDEFSFTSSVEGYGLSLELVASHDDGALAGMRTYRVYLNVAHADDQVTSFTGNDEFALSLNTTTNFYQNAFGGATSNDISAGAIGLVPELAFDSYVTIGLTGQPEGQEGSVELIPGSWADAFEAGQSFTINDGIGSGWYIVPPVAVNGLGGADQRVLVAQLTTDGDISGQFRTQVFPQGDQVNDVRADLTFVHNRACSELTIEESSETIAGDAAGNYTVVRTFTATDACGNSTSATQTITVQDTTAPEFTSVPADYTSECSDDLILDDATASDNCGAVTIEVSSETIAGDAAGNYTIVRTFTATDDAGNSTSAQQTITVQDTTAPEFTSIPADYTSECSDDLILDDATASDNCGEVTIEVSSQTIAGDAAGNYTVVRTFTATDDAGNSTSAQQTITVQDTTAPEFTSVPEDYTSECDADLILDDATASDNCGEVTIEVSSETIAGDAAGNYTVVRTFTATDDAGNSTSAQQTITVQDTTAPEFTSIPADYTSECSDDLILEDATASDNCGEVTIEVSSETIEGDAAGNYTVVRTFTATDDAGNSTSAQQTITVQDTTAPEFTSVPEDYNSECDADLILDDATASDNCGEVTIEVSSETIAGDAAGNYTVVRTFTATDDAGNSTSAQQTITVQDTTAPEFTSVPADYTSECDADLILDDASASDNCGEVTIEVSSETIAGDAAGNYTVVRTFTATDDAGNSTSAQQTITVQDTTAPELSIPADYTSECSDDLILEDATASDNCGEVTIEVSSETIAGDAAGNYTVVRTFTATDDAGNSTFAQQTITVQDTTAPELSIPADYTSECSDDLILEDATAFDNCGEVTIEVSSETIEGDAAGNYTVVRTFTATDDAGNSTSAQQTITVQDTTAPEFTSIPADYTSECSDDLILDDATASDNCGEVTIEVSSETIAGDAAGNYTVVRTFTATDDAGNSTSAQQTITVQDTTAPEFTSVPADYTSECDADLILDDATASDNCGEVTIEVSSETIAGDAAGNYTVVRTFTATDDAGNSTSAQQTITVQDTTAPEFTSVPADYTSECSDDLILDDATASDNCGEVTIDVSSETIEGDAAGNYTVVRTFTATDDAGNSTSAQQTITVQDTTAPELSIPADYTSECSDDLILDDATASDNCGEVTIEVSSETIAGDAAGNYTVVRTFTATDDAGNSTSAQQTITVQDTTAPELSIPADYTSECSDDLILDDATASDNCGEVTIEVSSETIAGDCPGNYTVVRTFTATDDAGNSTSAQQTITVQDTTAPELSIPADYTAECDEDLVLEAATATDNCTTCEDEFSFTSSVEGYGLSLELVASHNDGALAGMRTYRVYLDVADADDQVTSFTGNDEFALSLNTTTNFYQNALGGVTPNDISAGAIGLVPELAFDSYVTIGLTGQPEGQEGSVELIPGSWADAFEAGQSFTINDGIGSGWYIVPPVAVNGLGGADQRVLVAQLTTDGDISGQFRTQVFPKGDQVNDVRADLTFVHNRACSELTIEESSETIAGDAAGNYTVVRTFTATDACGNSTSAQQTITVQDTTAPEFTSVPADYTSECDAELILEDATASDNCGEVTIEVSSETIAGDAAGNYTVVRTFTATDDAGNSTSAQQTITVQDTTAPEFTSVPADYTSECDAELILEDATASDNCGEVTIEVSSETIAGDAAGNYTVVRTFTATDDAGNSTSAQQTITVQDTTAPEFTSVPADYTSECSDDLILDDATASDNCGEVTIEVSSETIEGDAAGNYTVVRTFTATDDAGNSTSAQQTITVQDTTAPEFTSIPADYTSECSDDLILEDATASDNCGAVTIEVSSETIAGDAAGNYTVVRTFTATDDAGNSTSAQQTITVQDTTAPELSIPADYTSECSDDLILDDATASDNCGEVTIDVSSETIAGDAAGNYTVVRTFTATDDAGNSTFAQQTIIVQDTTAPELSIPADYTSECSDDLILDDATASDNCGEVTIEVSSETIEGDAAGNYTVVRTFTATDDAGNSTSAQQTITVQDTTAPEFTSVPADYTVECSDEMPMDDATASDNCGEVTIDISSETIAGDAAGNYTVVRTFTATDDAGNSTSAQQTITVQDTTAPELSIPADYTSECDADLILDDASASDNCGEVTIEVSSETIAGDAAGNYTVVRTFTATDDAGNSTSAQQTITVQDTTAPELSIPADYTSECDADLILDDASASDNCGEVTIDVSSETIAGDAAGNYTVVRTFTATDDAGNSTSAQQTITVQDTTAPEFTSIPADYTSECSDDLILEDATASDNCGEVTIEVSSETIAGDAAGNYTVVRTFTATDDAGNSTFAQQTITVQDTTAPELSIPADYTSECSDDLILEDATAFDNCGEVTIEVSSETIEGDAAGNYTVVRTFTATDDAGNSTSAQQTITVQDTTAPEFTSIPADYTSECSDDLILDDATASDNCGEVTIEVSSETIAGDAAGNYTVVRTFTATDDAGNSTSAQQTITVQDTTAPEFTSVPADYTSECDADLILDDATASDNCGEVTIEVSSETIAGDAAGNYTVVRTFTATDDAGNSTSAQQTITVQDTTAPEFTSVPADYTSECSDDLILDDATASDNCGEVTIDVSSETIEGDAAGNYTVVRTFTATDDAGNSTSAQQTITVQDTTAPELSIPADYTSECSDDLILDDATASDNCGEVTIEVSSETIAGDAAGNYTVVRTFTATDDAGNSTSAQQTITVQDTTAPELSIPADYTSECSDDLILDDATASDNCGEVTIEVSSETIAGDCPGNYTVVRTFTATDDAGNSTSAQQTITVQDTTAPELSIPADYTAECDEDLVLEAATATDNCTTCEDEFSFTSSVEGYGLSLELVASHNDGALAGMRTYRVYLDVADADDQVTSFTGNDEFALSLNTTTNFYQNALGGVTPNDISAGAIGLVPELAFDSYVTIGLTGQPEGQEGSVELIPGSWADAFEAGQSFTINDGIGSGWYIVPPVAVNGLGGADQRVLVAQLTTDGDISGQFRTQVFPKGDQVNDVRADLTFVHNRACSELTIEESSETIAGDAAGNYTVVRTFTATDACGNSTSAQQTITVQDTTAPEFTSVPADYTSECDAELILEDATASDNCGEVTIEVSSETIAGDAAGNYTVVRTFTATDDAGNSTSAQQTITVQDTTAPEFTSVPADYTSECDAELILEDATASDNCGEVTIEVSSETIAGDAAGNYTVVRTFTATDDAGNSTSAQQTITVQDTTAPEFTSVPADYTSECDADLILDDATASDNCGEVTIEVSSETIAGDAAGNYTVVRTFTATDDAGNSTSAQQTITVQDTTAPEFTSVPADYTVECSDEMPMDDATASDNCGEVTIDISSETIAGDAAGNYTVVRTFTATDDAGNSTSAQQTITVQDTTAPELSIPADYTSECSDDLILDDATASDNCGEVTIDVSSETIAGDAAGNYTVVRTFTATDDAGNSTSAQQTITVQDTTAPEFTSVPADYTSECDADLILDDATASDNCGEVTIEVSSETTAGDAAGNYTIVRTFTATDDAGNSTFAQQTIIVQDTTAPELSIPADYTSECSDDLILDDATASDNCGEVTIEVSSETIEGDAAGNYTVVRTFTATDDAGNSTSAQQTITVQDTTAPEFTSVPADYTVECSDEMPMDDATASDNCGEVTIDISSETIAGDAAGNYTVVRTFTATDDAGNSTSAQQTITVQDTTAPELSIPADYTSECDADLILDDASASDNCGEVTIEVSSETIAGDAAGNYTVVRTFTATDDAGNSTSAQQTITVQDTTAPEFTSIPADYTSECDADLILEDATASDNCGEVTIEVSSETIAGDAAGNYTVVRTFTATDDAGNSTSAQQTITVQDTTAPEFTSIPADYTSECDADLILDDATASDNCGEVTIDVSSETIAGDAAGNYTVVRTFTATDDAGNSTSAQQAITVQDTTAPELSIPADYTSECSDDLILEDATASDNCGEVTIEVSSETIAGDAAGNYTVVRTFTATDDAGNSTSAQQTITVQDTTAPEFTSVPADYTSECDADLILDDATASDNCGEVTIEVSSETIAGDAAGNYTVVRTFTATDDAGNSTSAQQTITVQDTTAPEFTSVPADYTSECDADLILDDATASDNCGEVTIEVSSETISGDAAGNYTVVRTFTATDDAGNSTTAQQTISVQDTTAPELSIPADYTSECDADLILDDATASDNCGEVTIEVSSETISGDAAGNYTVVRTFTATDDAGNSTSAQQTITVQDTTAPALSIPADYTSECSDDLILEDATASDNCGEVTIEVSSETIEGDAAGNYTVVRTFTATDDAGNSTSAQQTITVQDTTAPELSIPADYTSECSDDLILEDATASDNCGEVTIEVSSETIAGDAAGNYTVIRTFTATDDAGNSTSAQQTITVQDTTAPEFTSVPADYTSECSDDLILDDATASDNCGEVTIEVSSETIAGDAAGNYTVVRTFTATDDAGNSTSAQQTITVQDTTAPEFTSVPADYTSECDADLILDDATASDNCGEVTIEVSSETIAGDAAGNYTVVRTFTATDDAGNSTSAQQTITVQDTTAPEFTSVPADYTSECSDDLILEDATASDNCGEVTIEVSSETISGDAAGNYTVVRTFTATDDAGNSTSAQQTITVQDTTAPELSIPADYTSECDADLILDDATASDNCGEVTIEVSSETIAGDAAGNYTVVRTFTATDDAGNSTSAQQTITVQDTTAPEFTSVPEDYTSECDADLILDDASASDNCGEVTIEVSSETTAGDAAGNYTVVRTFTATDDAGNSTSATQTITVQDTTAPEFTSIPADYTSECDADLILDDASASDNCGEVTIEVSSETIAGDAAGNYTVVRTFTATDDAGNSTSAQQTITVQDTTAPEFTSVPADYTSECDADLILEDATASDNCGEVTIDVSSETIAGDAAGNYTVVRTFTATDDAGNSTSAQQTITVQDTTAPELSIPADYTSECDADLILDDATASDNCGEVTIEVSSETIAGDAAGNYTVVRTFTATDDAGNSTSAQQTITVQDTTAPELSIPADYTSECDADLILDDATASDNCGEVVIDVSSETIAGDAAGNYTVVRTFTATDDAGNSTSAQQTITVQDTTAPELSIPADYTSECDADLILDDASASDNCGAVSIELSEEILDGSCVNGYVMLRTFTATDDAGNSTSATQTITVVDTTGPDLFIPPSYEADCGDDLLLLDALANDACGLAIVTVEETYDYTCDNSYVLTRTFTAVDACFNETVGVQTITVTDSTAPEFTSVPSGFSAECSDDLILDDATATDDCSAVDVTVAIDTIPGDCDNTYTLVRTFTASDACGNSSTATQTIEISDTTAPTFTFVPEDQLIECNIGLDGTMATAEDACGDVTVTVDEVLQQGQCGGVYVITRTFTATDACGNSTSAVQTITQQDTTDPTLSIGADVTIECDEEVPAPEYVADDACGAVTVEVTEEMVAGDCPQEMTILRTYVATDDCGNSTTSVQTINIEDTTAPIFTFTPPATDTVYAAEGDTLADPFVVVLDNCDTEASWSVDEQVLVDSPNELTVERLYTATDACGNEATYTETTTLVLQVLGCTDPTSCNFDEFANEDDGSCFYPLYAYDCDGNCINDVNDNDICDELEVAGCTDPENPGYNPEANIDDGSCLTGGCTIAFACNYDPSAEFQIAGSCEFESCAGCTSEEACNYDEDATLNNGSCEFPDYAYDCDGNCINDADGDGICDEFEIAGCTDPDNPAYNPAATDDDGSCLVAGCLLPFACNFDPTADYLDVALCDLSSCAGCTDPAACTFDPDATLSAPSQCTYPVNQFVDCDGVCLNDVDGDGVCDELEIPGCTNPEASNFSPFATDDNGTCIVEVGGCTLPFACNYDPTADFYLPGSCDFSCLFGMPPGGDDCSDEFACNFGADEPCVYFDGAGNLCATVGCMNEEACNFNPDAQVNSGCEYASCQSLGCTNVNACNFDLNANTDNGTCEYSSCVGCMNNEASNFDPEATIDNGQCTYDVFGCTLLIACNYNPSATVNDGTCDFAGCFGCVTPTACNYNVDALYPDGSCEFASAGQDCNGNCLQDQDGDFICDANEVAGCTDGDALNFNPNATDDNGSCTYLTGGCTNQTACNFDYTAQVDDGSCDFATCSGCIVSWACNYDETATLNDGSCIFPDVSGQCPNSCDFDVDGDGICDSNEVLGCTYVNATNYLALATDDDGSCSFLGCIEPDFSSYNALANTDDGGCTNSPKSADFNGDGVVQLEDLLEFLVAYGSAGPDWGLDWVQDGCSVVAMGIADMDVSTSGCTYPTAANFDPTATMDLGTCVWLGCTDDEALNYNNLATLDDSSCRYNVCPDFNGDGQVQTQDLLDFLVAWGQVYE